MMCTTAISSSNRASILFTSFATVRYPHSLPTRRSSDLTASGATVSWTTDRGTTSQVSYGTTSSYGSTTTLDNTLVTRSAQTTTGLASLIHHQCPLTPADDRGANSGSSPAATFSTSACALP